MSVGQRLMLLVAMPIVGAGFIGYSLQSTLNEVRVGGEHYQKLDQQKTLLADILPPPLFVVELFSNAQSLVNENDPARRVELTKEIERLAAEFSKREAYWKEKKLNSEVRAAVFEKAADAARDVIAAVKTEVIPAANAGDLKTAAARLQDKVGPAFVRHFNAISAASAKVQLIAEQQEKETLGTVSAAQSGSIYIAIGVLAGILPISYIMMRSVQRPIRQLSGAMHDVVKGTGNLRAKIDLGGDRSEIGQLAQNFNGFIGCVNGLVLEIEKMAENLKGSADQISASAEESRRATQHQTESLKTMLDGVDQLSGSAQSIAEISNQATSEAEKAGKVAEEGDKAVHESIEGMGRIDSTVSQGAQSVSDLGERSKQIGQIISVINDIADQTNLLALNAAIEAARAGEHGRGFAVVADEVRKLAERTTSATKEVSESIGQIQAMTAESVKSIHAGTEEVKRGIAAAQGTTENLKRIVEQAGATRRLIENISRGAQEQAKLGEGIRDGVRQVSTAAEELERTSVMTAQNTADLAQRSRQLMDLVARFQIDRGESAPRVDLKLPITSTLGTIVEINKHGACVEINPVTPLTKGQKSKIEFTAMGRVFRAEVTVQWTKKENGKDRAGLQFKTPLAEFDNSNTPQLTAT
jgi:methyl-accepting chemotaxis protein